MYEVGIKVGVLIIEIMEIKKIMMTPSMKTYLYLVTYFYYMLLRKVAVGMLSIPAIKEKCLFSKDYFANISHILNRSHPLST